MAKEDNILEPQVKSGFITRPVSLFADVQPYSNNSFESYNPARLHIHATKEIIPVGMQEQLNYVDNLQDDKIDSLMHDGYNTSGMDFLRAELGKLWYNNLDGTLHMLNDVYDNSPENNVRFQFNGTDLTFSTPFIKYTTQNIENKEILALDHLQMEKISDSNSLDLEKFRIHVGKLRSEVASEEKENYKLERFFKFAKRLAGQGKIEKVDLLTEIQTIPPTPASNEPAASVQNFLVYNDHLPRKEISDKIKELNQLTTSGIEPIMTDVLMPNYNCHSLYQYVNNFGSKDEDANASIEKYKNYLKDFITFKDSSVTNLDTGNIYLYLEQYLGALNKGMSGDQQFLNYLTKSINIVLMQSMLKFMNSRPADSFYFPAGLIFDMILPVTDDKISAEDNPDTIIRRKSLIEALDRWDLDYTVLKAIVENVGFNPGKNDEKFTDGYKSNYTTHRPLFSETDQIVTFPSIGYSQNDTGLGSPSIYTNINSFPFLNTNHEVDEPLDQDISFLPLYIDRVTSNGQFEFSFFGENIYDQDELGEGTAGFANHIYLDVPGDEDSTPGNEFIKRNTTEDEHQALNALINFISIEPAILSQENNLPELIQFRANGGKTRSFSDILNQDKASSEILYWRIEKKDRFTGLLVQNIFIPNAPEFNPKVFVDNQLLEDKEYEYTIYAWHVIYGTKYSYELDSARLSNAIKGSLLNFSQFQEDNLEADYFNSETTALIDRDIRESIETYYFDINVRNEPYLQMVEIPYYSIGGLARARVQTRLITSIPSPPSVEVVPYEGTNNAMLFLLNAAAGTIEKDFMIGINPEDDEKLYSIYQMLMNNNTTSMTNNMKIEFNTTSVDRFEIYRLEEKPKSYKDFTNGKLIGSDGIPGIKPTEIYGQNENEEEIVTNANTLSFKDVNIVPNKKYYYTFRVIDKNGNFSNPTAVYEIEIVDDNGTIYPIIDTVDFDFETNLQSMKNVRKYLHIVPTLEQSLLDLDTNEPDYDNQTAGSYIMANGNKNPKLGISDLDYKIFKDKDNETDDGKKEYFKIRMTSKKTGKKVDINVKFKVKHNETKEQKKSLEEGSPI